MRSTPGVGGHEGGGGATGRWVGVKETVGEGTILCYKQESVLGYRGGGEGAGEGEGWG